MPEAAMKFDDFSPRKVSHPPASEFRHNEQFHRASVLSPCSGFQVDIDIFVEKASGEARDSHGLAIVGNPPIKRVAFG
ncbi:hypothetical protein BJI49_13735 [Acetobacter pasteurianus]|nr:hypothetical protein BJI49_13735 [Acetobacter pasteurianus]